MKIGDLVSLVDEPSAREAWTIVALRSDSRGIWVQFNETPSDTWHYASHYKVINENR